MSVGVKRSSVRVFMDFVYTVLFVISQVSKVINHVDFTLSILEGPIPALGRFSRGCREICTLNPKPLIVTLVWCYQRRVFPVAYSWNQSTDARISLPGLTVCLWGEGASAFFTSPGSSGCLLFIRFVAICLCVHLFNVIKFPSCLPIL